MSAETGFAVIGLGMGKHHCRAIQLDSLCLLVVSFVTDEEFAGTGVAGERGSP
jgi:hypothetical protein